MTSLRQLKANRENARHSTGPRTPEGKQVSRRNALRHGLTAETVIEILEDPEDYKTFEATITADYDARTAVERELVLRLASLLWRLRRATAIETDLLRMQAESLREQTHAAGQHTNAEATSPSPLYRQLRAVIPTRRARVSANSPEEMDGEANATATLDFLADNTADPTRTLSICFLQLINLDHRAFKRLTRYEAGLWRQTVQTIGALRAIHYRYP
jgi:hypothetical protein